MIPGLHFSKKNLMITLKFSLKSHVRTQLRFFSNCISRNKLSLYSRQCWVFTHCLIWCKRSFGKRLTSGCHIQCKQSSATFETMEEMHGLIHSEIILPAAKLDWKREVRFDGGSQADDRLVSKMRGPGVLKTP